MSQKTYDSAITDRRRCKKETYYSVKRDLLQRNDRPPPALQVCHRSLEILELVALGLAVPALKALTIGRRSLFKARV